MFNFFKKDPFKVVACVSGTCIPLEKVNDPVFSTKMMGDGFAIVPTHSLVVSPISGTVEAFFPTKHAFGIKNKEGIGILVHVGIDTVNLNGEGFNALVNVGDKVKAGQPILEVDLDVLARENIDSTVMTIFTEGYTKPIIIENKEVKAGDVLID